MSTIEELIRGECLPTTDFTELLKLMPNLQSIKTSTILLDALNAARFTYTKCLRSLIIDTDTYLEQRHVNTEPFCDMFPRIENLSIPVDDVESCQYVLDQLKDELVTVTFRIPPNDSLYSENEDEIEENLTEGNLSEDAFSDWIKELPKQYRVHKKDQQIHLRLK